MSKKNIVLIGLTGCGKSTVGKILAKNLRLPFVDMDNYIEAKEGTTISRIFETKGEAYFRNLEIQAAKELSLNPGQVIATGGGVVLNLENMKLLQDSGIILYIDRSPDMILKKINLKKRPLLANNPNHLYELDRERRALYESYADITVKNPASIKQAVNQAKQLLSPLLAEDVFH